MEELEDYVAGAVGVYVCGGGRGRDCWECGWFNVSEFCYYCAVHTCSDRGGEFYLRGVVC